MLLSFFWQGIYIFPDEACVAQTGLNFANSFDYKGCSEILNLPFGNTFPLYPILISPIYLFFKGMSAYYGILILNSLLVSSLVFPLFSIFKNFIKSTKNITVYTILLLFLSQVTVFEKTLMTESFFLFTCVWFLKFYLDSLNQKVNQRKNKVIALIFAALGLLIRPFGFILLLAFLSNEFFNSKHKKKIALLSLFSIAAIASIIYVHSSSILEVALERIQTLADTKNILNLGISFKSIFNSFILSTYALPFLLFLVFVFSKTKNPKLKKIKCFLISYIALNASIAIYHNYGYWLKEWPLNFSTRYLNSSLIYIFIFSFIWLNEKSKIKINKSILLVTSLIGISLAFIPKYTFSQVSNIDLFAFLSFFEAEPILHMHNVMRNIFLIISGILIILYIQNNKKVATTILFITLFSHSLYSSYLSRNFSNHMNSSNSIIQELKNKESKILYVASTVDTKWDFTYWALITTSNNTIDRIEPEAFQKQENLEEDYEYFISKYPIKKESLSSHKNMKLYTN